MQPYEQMKIKGITNVGITKVEQTLSNLETIFENRYLTDTTIMFHLLKTAQNNKEIKEEVVPRRRRV